MPHKIPAVPQLKDMAVEHYTFLSQLKKAVEQLQQTALPPDDPTNLKATGYALGINVQWTRSANAQRYTLYISNTPSRGAANPVGIAVDVGDSNYYNDTIGQANFSRYYWVRAWNGNLGGRIIGPQKAVTLAAGATVNPPAQPPASHVITTDQITGQHVPGTPVNPRVGGRGGV